MEISGGWSILAVILWRIVNTGGYSVEDGLPTIVHETSRQTVLFSFFCSEVIRDITYSK
jgi:hypothetical protein